MIFDTHAHYDDKAFDADRDRLLADLFGSSICNIINIGESLESTKRSIALAEQYEGMYAAVGVHPCEIGGLDEQKIGWLKEQAAHPKAVAIGEIGLDYHWEKEEAAREAQRHWFARQLDLARECALPAVIHSRDAANDTLQVMKEAHAEEIPGVIHCYSYSPEIAEEFLKMGYYIGIGGAVTFQNSKKIKETVSRMPLDRLLLETDAPYMPPEQCRRQRNDSGKLVFVAEAVAALRGITAQEVVEAARQNAERLFFRK